MGEVKTSEKIIPVSQVSNAVSSGNTQTHQSILKSSAGTTSASKFAIKDYSTSTNNQPSKVVTSSASSKNLTEEKQKNFEKIKSTEKLELSKGEPAAQPEKLSASDKMRWRLAQLKNNK